MATISYKVIKELVAYIEIEESDHADIDSEGLVSLDWASAEKAAIDLAEYSGVWDEVVVYADMMDDEENK